MWFRRQGTLGGRVSEAGARSRKCGREKEGEQTERQDRGIKDAGDRQALAKTEG